MAFLTFAEAKVVAPPLPPMKYPANTVQTIKGSPLGSGINKPRYHNWTSIQIVKCSSIGFGSVMCVVLCRA